MPTDYNINKCIFETDNLFKHFVQKPAIENMNAMKYRVPKAIAFDEVNRKAGGLAIASIAHNGQMLINYSKCSDRKSIRLSVPERSSMSMREAKEPDRDGQGE